MGDETDLKSSEGCNQVAQSFVNYPVELTKKPIKLKQGYNKWVFLFNSINLFAYFIYPIPKVFCVLKIENVIIACFQTHK